VADIIRRRLGHYAGWQILDVIDVRLAGSHNRFVDRHVKPHEVWLEATARPTRQTPLIWPHDCALLFGALPVGEFWRLTLGKQTALLLGAHLFLIEELLVASFGSWGTVLVSIVVTAFFIPNMLHKGTLDLLLVKPMQRWRLLVYKFLGSLGFILLNAGFAVGGLWLVIGLRTGVWCHALLVLIPVLTFCFAILYSISALVAVLTHSPIVAMLITCVVWALLFSVDMARNYLHDPSRMAQASLAEQQALETPVAVLDGIHYVLPRTHDLGLLTTEIVGRELLPDPGTADSRDRHSLRDWAESLGVSLAFIAVMLTLACIRFSTKDY
jgi:hypothetical protein